MSVCVKSTCRSCESNRRSHCVHIWRPLRVVCRGFTAKVERHVSSACLRALQHRCSLFCLPSASEQEVLHCLYRLSAFTLVTVVTVLSEISFRTIAARIMFAPHSEQGLQGCTKPMEHRARLLISMSASPNFHPRLACTSRTELVVIAVYQ
jgi:hypothetical protein